MNKEKEEQVINDIDYVRVAKSKYPIDKKYIEESGVPTQITYYCKDCKNVVKPKRTGNKLKFSCTECKGTQVSFGSDESIHNFYKIKKIPTE